MLKSLSTLIFLTLLSSVTAFSQGVEEELDLMLEWMTGEFQASGKSGGDITWRATEIWEGKPNGKWIYVELDEAKAQDGLSGGMIYFITSLSEGELTADAYDLGDDVDLDGAWQDPSRFDGMTVFDLKHRSGCTLFVFYDGFQFDGRTNRDSCPAGEGKEGYKVVSLNLTPGAVKYGDDSLADTHWTFERK